MRTVHPLTQGSADWQAHRARIFNASEAPAVMGASKYTTRSQLLSLKSTGIAPQVDSAKQALFDKGHAVEAPTISLIEELAGDELAPVVASIETDGLTLGASYDGLTMMEDMAAEVKLWNEDLAAQIRRGELEPHYYWQLEQQFIVTPALRRIIFATSDGTRDKFASMEYRPVPGRREQLIAAWRQFAADLATFTPSDIKERPSAEVTLALPALVIHAKGEITTSNMKEYGEALAKRLAEVRAIQLVTDQDFSNAKESAKLLRENIQQAKHAKEAMLAQTVSVGEAARMIDTWCEDMRLTALKLEQDVEREDKAKKVAMIDAAKAKYAEHVVELDREISPARISLAQPVFAEAIKNKRNFASMQDALDTMMANAKIAANEQAATIQFNRKQLRPQNGVAGDDWISLFPDFTIVCAKSRDDFNNLVTARVAAHRQKLEQERARIRAEEQAKAEREARERIAAEQRAQVPVATQAPVAAPAAPPALSSKAPAANSPSVVPIARGKPTLRLGQINERIAPLAVTAAGLESLGFKAAGKEGAAVLFHAADLPVMIDSMVSHLHAAQQRVREAEAA